MPAENTKAWNTSPAAKEALENIDAGEKFLRSKDNELAPVQDAYFHAFSVQLVASYNKDPARIQDLGHHLTLYISLDTVNSRNKIGSARLTVDNEKVIKALINHNTRKTENSVQQIC